MDAETKNRMGSLKDFNDIYWNEFQEKTKLEWRISFGIWTVYLALIAKIITSQISGVNYKVVGIYLLVSILLGVGHFCMLHWVQKKLRVARKNMSKVRDEMASCLKIAKDVDNTFNKSKLKHVSLVYQIIITILLVGMGCAGLLTKTGG